MIQLSRICQDEPLSNEFHDVQVIADYAKTTADAHKSGKRIFSVSSFEILLKLQVSLFCEIKHI